MKRILTALLVLAVLTLPALAEAGLYEGEGFAVSLPAGLNVLPAETVAGYFAGAAADIGDAVAGAEAPAVDAEAILLAATEDGASSVSIISEAGDGRTALELASAAAEDLRDLVDGLSAGEAAAETVGETEFASVRYSLYGNEIRQYYAVAAETVYVITFTNLDDEAVVTVLESFVVREPAASAP